LFKQPLCRTSCASAANVSTDKISSCFLNQIYDFKFNNRNYQQDKAKQRNAVLKITRGLQSVREAFEQLERYKRRSLNDKCGTAAPARNDIVSKAWQAGRRKGSYASSVAWGFVRLPRCRMSCFTIDRQGRLS